MKATRTRRTGANPEGVNRRPDASTLCDADAISPLPDSLVKIVFGPWRRPCWRWDLARSMRQRRDDPPDEFVDAGVLEALRLLDDPASVGEATRQALRLFLDSPPILRDMV